MMISPKYRNEDQIKNLIKVICNNSVAKQYVNLNMASIEWEHNLNVFTNMILKSVASQIARQ